MIHKMHMKIHARWACTPVKVGTGLLSLLVQHTMNMAQQSFSQIVGLVHVKVLRLESLKVHLVHSP